MWLKLIKSNGKVLEYILPVGDNQFLFKPFVNQLYDDIGGSSLLWRLNNRNTAYYSSTALQI